MIFFGTKGKTVSGQVVDGIQCPSCEKTQFMTFGIIRYFHLYWIPTFVTSKKVGMECTHCKRTLLDKEIPSDLSRQIKDTVFTNGNTIPLFSGLIIIGCFVLFGIYSVQESNKQEAVYMEQPAVNDYYIVDLTKVFPESDPSYKYGLMRIKQVSSQRVEFQVGNMAYNKASGVRKDIRDNKASSDGYYDKEPFYMELSKLKATGAIYSIDRR